MVSLISPAFSEELCERVDSCYDLFPLACHRKVSDGSERIVNEMWVNLVLQEFSSAA